MIIIEIISSVANAIGIGKWMGKYISPEPEIRDVNINYPQDSGLAKDAAENGKILRWCAEADVQTEIDLNGANKIFTPPNENKRVILRVKSRTRNLILISKDQAPRI